MEFFGEAFKETSIESIIIPDSVMFIQMDAFLNCTSLVDVTLPIGIEYIGYGAFKSCTSLKNITIPHTVREIDGEVFFDCSSLEKIIFKNENTKIYIPKITAYGEHSGPKDYDFFKGCKNLISVTGNTQAKELFEKHLKYQKRSDGCYIATAVYGSYDCPEVWVLRRYRDLTLSKTNLGRTFIKFYYTLSPKAVKLFGDKKMV